MLLAASLTSNDCDFLPLWKLRGRRVTLLIEENLGGLELGFAKKEEDV